MSTNPLTPPANEDILLNFDGVWRVGRYLTTAAHFAACMENPVFDIPSSPRFYVHADGVERLLLPTSIDGWHPILHEGMRVYRMPE